MCIVLLQKVIKYKLRKIIQNIYFEFLNFI